jgi:hypothetical protein
MRERERASGNLGSDTHIPHPWDGCYGHICCKCMYRLPERPRDETQRRIRNKGIALQLPSLCPSFEVGVDAGQNSFFQGLRSGVLFDYVCRFDCHRCEWPDWVGGEPNPGTTSDCRQCLGSKYEWLGDGGLGHSIAQSVWARAYYQQQRYQGKDHHAAVGALAFKWIRMVGELDQKPVPKIIDFGTQIFSFAAYWPPASNKRREQL